MDPLERELQREKDLEAHPSQDQVIAPIDESHGLRAWLVNQLHQRSTQRLIVNVLAILVFMAFVHLETGKVFTERNLPAIAIQISVITVIASAMTLVMVAGAIDVSVAGVVVLGQVVAGILILNGVPVPVAFVIAVIGGALVGLFNAFLVIVVGITSLIATIGTLFMAQGIGNLMTNGIPLAGLPKEFATIGTGFIFGVPIAVPTMLIVVAIFVFIEKATLLGRHVVSTGSNPVAAFLNGVNVRRVTTTVFILSGAAAGWGGVMYGSRIGTAFPTMDPDLLFQVIVAIVVGGASLTGGQGSVIGTFVGCIMIGVLNNGLNLLGVSTYWQYIALGVLLVLAVGSDEVLRHDLPRRFRRSVSGALRSSGSA